jgi:hypothetical protein
MIDWVIPPKTAMALYIYRVRDLVPQQGILLQLRNSLGLLGPPVRPVRPTGQTGVAVAGLTTRRPIGLTVEGHRSDQWRQPDQLCANFGCEQEHIGELLALGSSADASWRPLLIVGAA